MGKAPATFNQEDWNSLQKHLRPPERKKLLAMYFVVIVAALAMLGFYYHYDSWARGPVLGPWSPTEQITYTDYAWATPSGTTVPNITLTIRNACPLDLSISEVSVDGTARRGVTGVTTKETDGTTVTFPKTIMKGSTWSFVVILSGGFLCGTQYGFRVLTSKGNQFGPYTLTVDPTPPLPNHDVTVNYFIPSKTVVGQGYAASIRVTVRNKGEYAENTDLAIIADPNPLVLGDEIIIFTRSISLKMLGSFDQSVEIMAIWNTTSWHLGNYTLSAFVSPVNGETKTLDNTRVFGIVRITIPGDVNGDFVVNDLDAYQIRLYWQRRFPSTLFANDDINGDGTINIKDATIVGVNWLKHA